MRYSSVTGSHVRVVHFTLNSKVDKAQILLKGAINKRQTNHQQKRLKSSIFIFFVWLCHLSVLATKLLTARTIVLIVQLDSKWLLFYSKKCPVVINFTTSGVVSWIPPWAKEFWTSERLQQGYNACWHYSSLGGSVVIKLMWHLVKHKHPLLFVLFIPLKMMINNNLLVLYS